LLINIIVRVCLVAIIVFKITSDFIIWFSFVFNKEGLPTK
jgi:hypothetical protein